MVITVLFVIIITITAITTAVKEAAMITVQEAVLFGVGGVGYPSPRCSTERVPSSEGRTRRVLA